MQKKLEWEKTVEAKRKKEFLLSGLAIAAWAALIFGSQWAEKQLYGGVIQTKIALFSGIFVGQAIGMWIHHKRGVSEPSPKARLAGWIFVIACSIFLFWWIISQKASIFAGQMIMLLLVGGWGDYKRKKEGSSVLFNAAFVFLTAVSLLIGTMAGILLGGFTTVPRVQQQLEQAGFTETEYIFWMYGRWLQKDIEQADFYREEMADQKYYLFSGEKDGALWRMVVDPKGGELLYAATEQEEPELANWDR